jgi:hypothetical protein
MDSNALKIYLVPKAFHSSLDHFHFPRTHTYFSKPNGTNIHNHRPIIPLGGHVWLFKVCFLSLYGYTIHLCPNINTSSLGHVQGPMTHTKSWK